MKIYKKEPKVKKYITLTKVAELYQFISQVNGFQSAGKKFMSFQLQCTWGRGSALIYIWKLLKKSSHFSSVILSKNVIIILEIKSFHELL